MFLILLDSLSLLQCFLCMRRDVSSLKKYKIDKLEFSLHAQRCFLGKKCSFLGWKVFSACAEMFLLSKGQKDIDYSFLCMRRDVSYYSRRFALYEEFSLHAQRCFYLLQRFFFLWWVFSACAEMFLIWIISYRKNSSFLCMRRDVSIILTGILLLLKFSLHAQRCFPSYWLGERR